MSKRNTGKQTQAIKNAICRERKFLLLKNEVGGGLWESMLTILISRKW